MTTPDSSALRCPVCRDAALTFDRGGGGRRASAGRLPCTSSKTVSERATADPSLFQHYERWGDRIDNANGHEYIDLHWRDAMQLFAIGLQCEAIRPVAYMLETEAGESLHAEGPNGEPSLPNTTRSRTTRPTPATATVTVGTRRCSPTWSSCSRTRPSAMARS